MFSQDSSSMFLSNLHFIIVVMGIYIIVLTFLMFSILSVRIVNSSEEINEIKPNEMADTIGNSFRNILGSFPGRRLGRLKQTKNIDDVAALKQVFQSSSDNEWQQFTASPIPLTNCFVEVQLTQRIPGRCTKLGGRIPACQAQDFVTIDYGSCES